MRTIHEAQKVANMVNKIKLFNTVVFSATAKENVIDSWHVDVYEIFKKGYSPLLLHHKIIAAYCVLNNHYFMIFVGPDNHPCYRIR